MENGTKTIPVELQTLNRIWATRYGKCYLLADSSLLLWESDALKPPHGCAGQVIPPISLFDCLSRARNHCVHNDCQHNVIEQGVVMLRFVDRKNELETLERFYHATDAGLLVMLGRHRVGKMRLLFYFLRDKAFQGASVSWQQRTGCPSN